MDLEEIKDAFLTLFDEMDALSEADQIALDEWFNARADEEEEEEDEEESE